MSTTSPPSALVGAQQPRLSSVPDAPTSAGQEVIDLAASAGLHLDPWQQLVLRGALGEKLGRWAAFEVGLVVPRQNGKNSVLEALELAALFLPEPDGPPPLVLHSAQQFKTSAEHFRRMRDLIANSESLTSRVRIIRTAAGAETIELHSGARLRFVTRTGDSGRGFSADLIVIDEAYNLTAESMAAILPTLSARPNPQIWYTSSAGMDSSEQLARLRTRGKAGGDSSLAYFEWSVPEGSDFDDRNMWAQANPALGRRIPEHFVAAERAALPDEQFARERLGIWANHAGASAIDPNTWAALAAPDEPQQRGACYGLATAPDRSWTCLAAAWRRADGVPQVSIVRYDKGTGWVAQAAAGLKPAPLVDVAARGLVPGSVEVTQQMQAKAHNALADAVLAGAVRHDDEPELNMAVRSSKWRDLGDTRVFDRKGAADISPLVASSLALLALLEHKPRGRVINLAEISLED